MNRQARELMAQRLERVYVDGASQAAWQEGTAALVTAAAELRKTCISCGSFSVVGDGVVGKCSFWNEYVAIDGEGFCHMWEPQPAAPQEAKD